MRRRAFHSRSSCMRIVDGVRSPAAALTRRDEPGDPRSKVALASRGVRPFGLETSAACGLISGMRIEKNDILIAYILVFIGATRLII